MNVLINYQKDLKINMLVIQHIKRQLMKIIYVKKLKQNKKQ